MKILNLTLLFMALLVTSCGSDDGNNSNQEAIGNFTAKINGTDYNAEFVNGFIVGLGTNISISGSQSNGNNVVIGFPINAEAGDTFTVNGLQFNASYDTSNGEATLASEGTITINAHNPDAKTVSGTFSFVAEPVSGQGTAYNITEGSFSSSYNDL